MAQCVPRSAAWRRLLMTASALSGLLHGVSAPYQPVLALGCGTAGTAAAAQPSAGGTASGLARPFAAKAVALDRDDSQV